MRLREVIATPVAALATTSSSAAHAQITPVSRSMRLSSKAVFSSPSPQHTDKVIHLDTTVTAVLSPSDTHREPTITVPDEIVVH